MRLRIGLEPAAAPAAPSGDLPASRQCLSQAVAMAGVDGWDVADGRQGWF